MSLSPSWLSWPETQKLINAFNQQKAPLRFVGGCVRDALLGREVHDVDAATTLLPEEIEKLLNEAGIKTIPTGIDHGTITAIIDKKPFEITTLRKDISTDGRYAEVAYTDDWQQDAARRDFTMNALYLSPQGELFDYFDGEIDAHNGVLRFIGGADERIAEDYLRILRFFRFYAHYGKTAPDEAALTACTNVAANIKKLSGERIQHEMLKLLNAPQSHRVISIMNEQGILPHVLGFAISDCGALRRIEEIEQELTYSVSPTVKLAALILVGGQEASLKTIAERWKLSGKMASQIKILLELQAKLEKTLSISDQKKLIRKHGAENFCEAILLAWAKINDAIDASHPYHSMLKLADEWIPPIFPITGKDLKEIGMAEGTQMGETLRGLEEKWEASDYTLSKEKLLKMLS